MEFARMRAWMIAVILIVATAALIFLLNSVFPDALQDDDNRMQLFASLGWLALLGSSVVLRLRSRPGSSLRALAAWVLIFLVLVWVYAYRVEAMAIGQRLLAVLVPGHGYTTTTANSDGTVSGQGEMRFAVNRDGHYQVNARVNGAYVTFLVDTGATDVVLTMLDAQRIGFDPAKLRFTQRAETANGVVRAAPVTLDEIALGPIVIGHLPASVNEAPMSQSLLGMRFLNQLKSWRVENQMLILQQ
jgi:aspartyl protease family protein